MEKRVQRSLTQIWWRRGFCHISDCPLDMSFWQGKISPSFCHHSCIYVWLWLLSAMERLQWDHVSLSIWNIVWQSCLWRVIVADNSRPKKFSQWRTFDSHIGTDIKIFCFCKILFFYINLTFDCDHSNNRLFTLSHPNPLKILIVFFFSFTLLHTEFNK